MAIFTQENILLGLAYRFKGLVLHPHDRNHGSMQGDIELEKELRVLHPGPQAAERD